MKKKIVPVLVVVGLIFLIIGITVISMLVKKHTPSKEVMDSKEYYGITSDDQVAIILDQKVMEEKAKSFDGSIYIDYNFLHDNINSRFYWDHNENILLYATDKELISADADSSSYYVAKNTEDFGKVIVKATADSAYVSLDFVELYTNISVKFFEDPSRVIITSGNKSIATAPVKKSTQVRLKGGIKSPILSEVSKEDNVQVIEAGENWTKVMTSDGYIGYMKAGLVGDTEKSDVRTDVIEEKFSHIVKDFKINMAWHQVTTYAANNEVANMLASTKGVNVISPTWFHLNDNKGNLEDIASSSYVSYCHQQGVEVWALVNNLDNPDVDTTHVLTHTSTRQNLVNQIVASAIKYELDGINLDFESLNGEEVGDSYIQFVRELSIKLGNNGIVLSVDNYVPAPYTAFYNRAEQANFADYVVIMGYDQHYNGSDSGSVAALDWVTQGVEDTLKEVPSSQVILGMPFYTRVWELKPKEGSESAEVTDENSESELYNVSSKTYTMTNAANLVSSFQAKTTWDETCGQNFASWEDNGVIYKVWLEDSKSFEARLPLLDKYSLAGASYWKLGLENKSIWDTIIKYIN